MTAVTYKRVSRRLVDAARLRPNTASGVWAHRYLEDVRPLRDELVSTKKERDQLLVAVTGIRRAMAGIEGI